MRNAVSEPMITATAASMYTQPRTIIHHGDFAGEFNAPDGGDDDHADGEAEEGSYDELLVKGDVHVAEDEDGD